MISMWLDDVRPAPTGWVQVRSVDAATALLQAGLVRRASLAHDLGTCAHLGGDGYRVVDWMAEHDVWPPDGVQVHSANPVGRERIQGVVDRYGPYP